MCNPLSIMGPFSVKKVIVAELGCRITIHFSHTISPMGSLIQENVFFGQLTNILQEKLPFLSYRRLREQIVFYSCKENFNNLFMPAYRKLDARKVQFNLFFYILFSFVSYIVVNRCSSWIKLHKLNYSILESVEREIKF